jgi:putative SOS response-associated peptidase YedK
MIKMDRMLLSLFPNCRPCDYDYGKPLRPDGSLMCNLYSITTNQAAIIALFRVVNRYVGNLPPMPGVFPDYPAPVVRNTDTGRALTKMRWGMPSPIRTGGPPVTNIRNTLSPHWRMWMKPENRCLVPANSLPNTHLSQTRRPRRKTWYGSH